MPTLHHPDRPRFMSQCQAILDCLKESEGWWVPMHLLRQRSGAHTVHSRIVELRAAGHRISHKYVTGGHVGLRTRCSFYRLEGER